MRFADGVTTSLPPERTRPTDTVVGPDGRRLRISTETAWLLGEVEAGATLTSLATALALRLGRPVSEADARELLVRTLVAHGLAKLHRDGRVSRAEAGAGRAPEAASTRVVAVVLNRAATTAVGRALRAFGSAVTLALVAAAGLVLGAQAWVASRPADPAAWLDGRTWLVALFAWAGALFVHELGHAFAFARAGGAPGPIAIARLGAVPVWSCGVDGAAALDARTRIVLALAGPAWQLGAGACVLGALRLAHVPASAPLAAVLGLAPLLNLIPFRHADGDRVAAVLAGADDGGGLVRQPALAPGRSPWPVRLHGLAFVAPTAALAAWLAGALAPAAFAAGGAGARVVGVVAVAAAGAWAFVAGSLVARATRWESPDVTRRRQVHAARYVRNAWARFVTTLPLHHAQPEARDAMRMVPVMLSLSFPDRPAAALRRAARRHMREVVVTRLDHEELSGGGMADEIRHARAVQALIAARQGAVVCSMHLGPFHYVSLSLFELGAPITVFAASGVRRTWIERWEARGRQLGGSFEAVEAGTARGALRALRALEEGRLLVVYMDGQQGAARAREARRAGFRFCGAEIFMRTGPAFLAQRAGVPLLMGACFRDGPARRVVEFSDPLPPPVSGDEDALVARTADLYTWFEPRVRRHPEQWPGWLYPIMHWRETGDSPTATREAVEATRTRIAGVLAGGGATRLVADATRSGTLIAGDDVVLVHGPTHRVLAASPLTRAVLAAAHRGARLRDLPRATRAPADALALEATRLVLAGVAELRD